ncbi:unnamed protein product [Fraxinus pennsylvanica]|uniref:Protein kinase domain-containing protein n=1 Tax=Fraxinus pennsylvanica TaxID=56036 RepID=A0AAD1Z851_9LAMI|nr:unnamed protein product [Fraxinus pennsylvanica]
MCEGRVVARLPTPPPPHLHNYIGKDASHSTDHSSPFSSFQCRSFFITYSYHFFSYLQTLSYIFLRHTFTAMSLALHLCFLSFLFTQLDTDGVNAQGLLLDLQNPNQCKEKCGKVLIPFPFYVNQSHCGSLSNTFRLSCVNSSSLFLNIGFASYRVLDFFPDGVLVDFPNTTICRQYNDLKSFTFSENEYLGISTENVLDLYDCDDSSLCKADCEKGFLMSACDGKAGDYPSCCYPLSDHSVWPEGEYSDSFSVFSQFGCRGFSSWVALPGSKTARRGVKLEWAVPRNSTKATCAANAYALNASSVLSGMRCQCQDGFVGDGFSAGAGCLKSCFKDGKKVYGNDCYPVNHRRKKAALLAGILTSALAIASLTALFCLLKWPIKSDVFISDKARCQNTILSRKPCTTRLFTYHELEEATRGFEDGQKIVDGTKTTLYAGILIDGLHIVVQMVQCESQRDLIQVLSRVEALSAISHKNLACLVGWYIDSGYTPLVVYEYPANGTLEEHLHQTQDQKIALDWYKRLNIAAETACILAFLHEISPPIFHHNLHSGCIFLDEDFCVKLAGFDLLNAVHEDVCHSSGKFEVSHCRRNDVYGIGLVLLELITGTAPLNFSTALQKIKNGKLEEIVDPSLYYHEQPPFCREQIEIMADLATRCLLFGADGKLSMVDVARELVHITKDNLDGSRRGPALEETFSNSSLLQMISLSPDSIYVPSNNLASQI